MTGQLFSMIAAILANASLSLKPSDTIPGYLKRDYGITAEEHAVTTEDGYILTAFRMPRPGAPVVLLQHGVLSSAWCFLVNEAAVSPGLQLYEAGYDVWLTNSRGNTYSRNHTSLKIHTKAFWNFTFAKMGHYDVPANVRYILKSTSKTSLAFVGWSQGSSQFFVAMQDPRLKAELETSVNLFVALSPVTKMGHSKGLLKTISELRVGALEESINPYGFLTYEGYPVVVESLCKLTLGAICKFTVDLFCGTSELDNGGAITNMTAHFPAGISVKGLDHYEQIILDDKFENFNYGTKLNLEIYGSKTPPEFGISGISVPTALFLGGKDDLADPLDAGWVIAQNTNNSNLVFHQTFDKFSHVTWMVGKPSVFNSWFTPMLKLIKSHNVETKFQHVIV